MKIKSKPRKTKKQKAYLEWMGLEKPKSKGRMGQLNKHNRKSRHQQSELIKAIINSGEREVGL